jgi:hypothetical protein
MLRDVSGQYVASIFRIEEEAKQETSKKLTAAPRSMRFLQE